MKTQAIIALRFLLVMTIITGVLYPFFMTGVAQLAFQGRANGSLIVKDGRIIGSELIGQKFDSSTYFWSRPSSINYNPIPSCGSNLGPTNDKLKKQVAKRRYVFATSNAISDTAIIPKEMIFASASGLDPHISPEAAYLQVERVVNARNLNQGQKQKIQELIKNMTEEPQYFVLGESRINVLLLNLEVDKIK